MFLSIDARDACPGKGRPHGTAGPEYPVVTIPHARMGIIRVWE